jgi:hypothetical protein
MSEVEFEPSAPGPWHPKPIFDEEKIYNFDDIRQRHNVFQLSMSDPSPDIPIKISGVFYEFRDSDIFTPSGGGVPPLKVGRWDSIRDKLLFNKEGISHHSRRTDVPTEVSSIDVMPVRRPTPPLPVKRPMSPGMAEFLASMDSPPTTDDEDLDEEIEFLVDGIPYKRMEMGDAWQDEVMNEDNRGVGTWDGENIDFTKWGLRMHKARVKARFGKK